VSRTNMGFSFRRMPLHIPRRIRGQERRRLFQRCMEL